MEKAHVQRINEAVSSPTRDQFMKAVQCMVLPEKLLEAHYQTFRSRLDSEMTNEKFYEAVKQFREGVFVNNQEMKGSNFYNIKEYNELLQELMNLKWSSQQPLITEKLRNFHNKFSKIPKRTLRTFELHKLCKWLADYKWCGDKDFIEIPGQYTGEKKPFIQQHVKIVRVENQLKIFDSKQSPIELKLYGSDGKMYSFILKYGEDLRQDQRIQQALDLMSHQLSMDNHCKQNHLSIRTYQVIPINARCGMMSRVENAKTINEYIEGACEILLDGGYRKEIYSIREEYRNFLIADKHFTTFPDAYENAIVNRKRDELAKKLADMERRFPSDIIQKALMTSAVTLEMFYILRKNFITSLAAMNIAGWLLGIGDRHLSNILLDDKTGRLIHIDFGMAFGAASDSSVPELIPFRLTSHFVNVLEPLGIEGMIRKNMVKVLRCLRDSGPKILICLEVFVKEPTLDWQLKSKLKSVGVAETGTSEASSSWNPESRIAIVQRKLQGANPLRILKDELAISRVARKEAQFRAYMKLLDGGDSDMRNKLSEDGLSVDEQVTALIEMATDKALLACIYVGWDPWI